MKQIWYDGIDNYKKHTLESEDNRLLYTLELCDRHIFENKSTLELFEKCLSLRDTKSVTILYSGGLDSEIVLRACILLKIPVTTITLNLCLNGETLNTYDIYYSKKFCEQHKIKQTIVDLDIKKFFESGKYLDYVEPYKILEPHVATYLHLITLCDNFPVMGGDYSWPWVTVPLISPHKHSYNMYNRFMRDNNINGIGGIINHSLDLNVRFIENHMKYADYNLPDSVTKLKIYSTLGLGTFEERERSYGWDQIEQKVFNKNIYRGFLLKKFGTVKYKVVWGENIARAINGDPGYNDKFN